MPIIVFAIFVLIKDYFQYIYSWKLNREGVCNPTPYPNAESRFGTKGFLENFLEKFYQIIISPSSYYF